MRTHSTTASLLVSLALLVTQHPTQAGAPRAQDEILSVCLVGNSLAERLQHHGWLEARLHAQYPKQRISLRNLGFSADEVALGQRTQGFGTQDEHLARCGAEVVVGVFGFNESFSAPEGLPGFRLNLEAWVRHVQGQDYAGNGVPPTVLLVTSIPFENHGDPSLPDGSEHNARIQATNRVTLEVAEKLGVRALDLYGPMLERYEAAGEPLTINGIHLSERGNRQLADVVLAELAGERSAEPTSLETIRRLVLEKNLLWFNRYRATDGYNVYGGRSSLAYEEGQTNFVVLQRELEVIDALCANLDREIWKLTFDGPSLADVPVPDQIPVRTNKPGEGPDATHVYQSGEAAIADMTPAPGLEVVCFADERRFPELVNPVQMAWDTRGRLWVACWRTYPHWRPGEAMDDRLIVLEDTDGDGRADTCETFVDDLHNPTGFEFWQGGVLVANAPDLLFLRDTDGDGRCDRRERLLGGLSSADTHHSANSFVIGPDGALYFQEGTFHMSQVESVHGPIRNTNGCVWRFHPRTWAVERYVPYGFANPHGHVFDRWGQDFVTDGTGNNNYYALPFSGHLERPDKHANYFTFFRQRSRPAGGTEILSSPAFPADQQGDYLIANVIGFQGIFQYEVVDEGSGFGAVEVEPLVHSKDPNFRPVDIEVGPDGAVYFLDWQNSIIGHMQHHLRDPSRDQSHGRIYRVHHAGLPRVVAAPIAGRPTSEVVALLGEDFDRLRGRARIELSGRNKDEVLAAAAAWMKDLEPDSEGYEHALLEGLWLHAQFDALHRTALERLLEAEDARARAAATRVVRNMRHRIDDALELLRASASDEHPRVRLEAVVGLSFLSNAAAAEAALLVLDRPTDRFLDYALRETMGGLEHAWQPELAAGQPFAAMNPRGLAYALDSLDTESLRGVLPSSAKHSEVLSRHGLAPEDYLEAARGLAAMSEGSAVSELLGAVAAIDIQGPPHADHLIHDLFHALTLAGSPPSEGELAGLARLSQEGHRAATRRLALAAHLRTMGDVGAAWNAALGDPNALTSLLEALPHLDAPELAEALYPRVRSLLDAAPKELAEKLRAAPQVSGRFLRIELPGTARTLTLAEVEVWSGAENVAPRGVASQSSTNWDGVAGRAMDGNKNGVYGQNGQTHTIEDEADPWWELDLGEEVPIGRVELWNRTEGNWGARLDGYTVRILDAQRQTVLRLDQQPAPAPHAAHVLTPPAVRIRQAAAAGLLHLGVIDGVNPTEAIAELVARFEDAEIGATVAQLLTSLAVENWSEGAAATVADRLEAAFRAREPDSFEGANGRTLLALADGILPALPRPRALQLYSMRRRLGPQVLTLRSVPDRMLFDRTELTVVAGRPVEILFTNPDIMPHNWVLTAPGALALIGRAAEAMSSDPEADSKSWVPDHPAVLVASTLLRPGLTESLRFDAPATPGDYPYVCTFPGHWVRMNGVMHVVERLGAADALPTDPDLAGVAEASARTFVRDWKLAELLPALDGVEDRTPATGRAVFEAASCLKCHSVDGQGANTGPVLVEVLGQRERAELLRHILEPSLEIREGFESEVFVTVDERIHAGRVVEETETEILVQDDPYAEDRLVLLREEIAERSVSPISTMPEGLLSTFTQAEILDLLAYLESLIPE